MSVNKAILVGRLGKDPETRYTSAGQAVCTFSLATDETYKDRNGERQKRTEWHRITMWGKLAEIGQKYLKKGQLVFIEGRIQSRQWDDKNTGQKRNATDIVANEMRMLTSRAESGGGAGPSSAGGGDEFSQGGSTSFSDEGSAPQSSGPEISDEDIPF
jgi:single-strand DNA-binding protein